MSFEKLKMLSVGCRTDLIPMSWCNLQSMIWRIALYRHGQDRSCLTERDTQFDGFGQCSESSLYHNRSLLLIVGLLNRPLEEDLRLSSYVYLIGEYCEKGTDSVKHNGGHVTVFNVIAFCFYLYFFLICFGLILLFFF